MNQSGPRRPRSGRSTTTRPMRPRDDRTVRTALLTLIFLFLVPLFGIQVTADPASDGPATVRTTTASYATPSADFPDDDRGCHDGQPTDPHSAMVPRPEQPGSPVPKSTSTPPAPPFAPLAPSGTSQSDTTSVDLYRIQIIRT
ncbi:hypothetical protein [Streptomyces sp. KL118A]|uniref:hypothetical protein n=1 Tax=Streptomyces sp. KL118A TaxID=3045153 RepID=UPI00278BE272|nr:hypothetical protein [Streptomyces sp. KL118A]